jgi:outer membrane protein assembly factor BamB
MRMTKSARAVTGTLIWFAALVAIAAASPAQAAPQQYSVTVAPWSIATSASGVSTNLSWSLWDNDGLQLRSGVWGTAYSSTRYIEYAFPTSIPTGAVIASATAVHIYKAPGGGASTSKLLVSLDGGATWPYTHPLTAAGSALVQDTVDLPEVTTVGSATALRIRFMAYNADGKGTRTEKLKLIFSTNRGIFEFCPSTVTDRATGTAKDASDPLWTRGDAIASAFGMTWPIALNEGQYISFGLHGLSSSMRVVPPGSVIDSVTVSANRTNSGAVTLYSKLEVSANDFASKTDHALTTLTAAATTSDAVLIGEIRTFADLERMDMRFVAWQTSGTNSMTFDLMTVTIRYHFDPACAWVIQTGGAALVNPSAYSVTQSMYSGSNDGVIRSIAYQTGKVRWSYATTGAVQNQTAVRVNGVPRIFAGSQNGYLYCLDDSGTLVWKMPLAGNYTTATGFAAPAAGDMVQGGVAFRAGVKIGGVAHNTVYAGTYNSASATDNAFYAVDTTTQAVLWRDKRLGNDYFTGFPALDYTTNRVVYASYGSAASGGQGHVYCLDTTGTPIWDRALGGRVTGSPIIRGGKVWVGAGNGTLYALSLTDGTPTTYVPAVGSYDLSTPWPAGAITYVSSSKGSVYAIDAASGTVLHEATGLLGPRIPIVLDSYVYVGTNDGLVTLAKSDLAVASTYRTGYAVSSPTLDWDTMRFFFGDSAGRIYGVDSTGGLMSGPSSARRTLSTVASRAAGAAAANLAAAGSFTVPAKGWPHRRSAAIAALADPIGRVTVSGGAMTVTLSDKGGVQSGPVMLELWTPDEARYVSATLAAVPKGYRASRTWKIPVSGTWADGMRGSWRVRVGTSDGWISRSVTIP